MLDLQTFVLSNLNWREKLVEPPYCLKIQDKEGYVMFSYNMIDSDFSIKLVRESRGIILDSADNFNVACMAFEKFFHYSDKLAAKIDFASARIEEKVDGSILKWWYAKRLNCWMLSTNNMIDAREATVSKDFNKTFNDLFEEAMSKLTLDVSKLIKSEYFQYTFVFEIVSPYNRIVVPYRDVAIYHIGIRNNITLQEEHVDVGIQKPTIYTFNTLEDCIAHAKQLPFNEEGYVVVDKFWNRIKVKSVNYLAAHHMKNNGVVTYSRVLDMIRAEQHDDFLAIFPEYSEHFDKVIPKWSEFLKQCASDIEFASNNPFPTRKDYAVWAKRHKYPALLFAWLDKKVKTVSEYIKDVQSEKLLKLMGME